MNTGNFKESIVHHRFKISAVFFLILATLAVYAQVYDFEFVTFDDDVYVYAEPHVKNGLTMDNILWCFGNSHAFNWHPLTSISFFINAGIFGSNPGSYHVVNVVFHLLNTLLVLLVFVKMTGYFWRSLFIASLFALHPLHVESVAWISERKDVLSAFFWFLTMLCYWWYTKSPRISRYILVAVCLTLGLLAKQMLVTLPFVLLLMDYWPLNRLNKDKKAYSLIIEKIPLFLIVAGFSVVTFIVQRHTGMVKNVQQFPLSARIANAMLQYIEYLKDFIWPVHLSIFYPYPLNIMPAKVIMSAIVILAASITAVWFLRKLPYLAVGWFWYLGTLIPVIGIIQVGAQARADRYTYLPLIGIFIIIAWGIPELLKKWNVPRITLPITAGIVFSLCLIATWFQVGYWRDSQSLYSHALKVTEKNDWAHNMLGGAYAVKGHMDEAIYEYNQSLAIAPYNSDTYNSLGVAYMQKGDFGQAVKQFQSVLSLNAQYAEAHANLGAAYAALKNPDESIRNFSEALKIKPHLTSIHYPLADEFNKRGQTAEAAFHLQEFLKGNPSSIPARMNLGVTLFKMNRLDEAAEQFAMVMQSSKDSMQARTMYSNVMQKMQKIRSEMLQMEAVAGTGPKDPVLLLKLATLTSWLGEQEKSEKYLLKIIELKPADPDGYYNLACVYSKQKRIEEAVHYLREAVNRGFSDWKVMEDDPDLFNIRDHPSMKSLGKRS